jgi:hypothetical protein
LKPVVLGFLGVWAAILGFSWRPWRLGGSFLC